MGGGRRRGSHLYSAAGIAALGVVWVLLWLFSGYSIIPSPWDTILATLALFADAHTWKQILITLLRVGAGFLLALSLGTAAGVLSGKVGALERFFKPVTLFLQGIPPILWVIPLILLFGIGHLSPVLVIALICFPLVVVNIAEGMKTVPRDLEEMVQLFAPGTFPMLREVVLPHLRPFFSATLDLGFALGLKASVVGEFFGANNGMGFQIQAAYQSLQTRRLFAWGLILVLLIILTSRLFSRIGRILRGEAFSAAPGVRHGAGAAPRAAKPRADRLVPRDPEELYRSTHLPAPGQPPQVALLGVSFSYPFSDPLFEGVDLTVSAGDVAVISGESGSGKTTLLKIAAGLLDPTHGSVTHPTRVGFVFQDDRLIPWQTVLRNTALPLRHLGFSKDDSQAYATGILSEFGLHGAEGKFPTELSGGMRKRAALARCLARVPSLVLLDEPFSGLHVEARKALWRRFSDFLEQHPVPVILVTHYPEELALPSRLAYYTLKGKPARLCIARVDRRSKARRSNAQGAHGSEAGE